MSTPFNTTVYPPSGGWAPNTVGDEYFDYTAWEKDACVQHAGHSGVSPAPSLSSGESGRSSPDFDEQTPGTPPSMYYVSDTSGSPASSNGSSSSGRRSRKVENPAKTMRVREDGACVRCRMRKVPCEPGVCTACIKFCPAVAGEACIHAGMREIGTVTSLLQGIPNRQKATPYHKNPFRTQVHLDGVSALEISVIQYIYTDGSSSMLLDPAYASRIPDDLATWAGNAMMLETHDPFHASLHNFLITYLNCGTSIPRFDFAQAIWQLLCMWRIWKTQSFTYIDGNLHPELDEQIRINAYRTMKTAEEKIWADLDDCLGYTSKHKGFADAQTKPVLFVCLWELVLLYNEINKCIEMKRPEIASANPIRLASTARRMYVALLVFYTGYFYMPQKLEPKLEVAAFKVPRQLQDMLQNSFSGVLASRRIYLESANLESSHSRPDLYLLHLIVDHEQTKLLKSRSRKKKTLPTISLVMPEVPSMDDMMDIDGQYIYPGGY